MEILRPPMFVSGTKQFEGNLWSILGYFSQLDQPETMAFGGYFFLDNFLGTDILSGKLIDGFGPSRIISGHIHLNDRLLFDKKYDRSCSPTIHYEFVRQDDNLWLGSYRLKFKEREYEGHAKCIIHPCPENNEKFSSEHDRLNKK